MEHNTAASMQTLVKLDTLKGRMVASSQALREADNWTTLSTDIEEVQCALLGLSNVVCNYWYTLNLQFNRPNRASTCLFIEKFIARYSAVISENWVCKGVASNRSQLVCGLKSLSASSNLAPSPPSLYTCEKPVQNGKMVQVFEGPFTECWLHQARHNILDVGYNTSICHIWHSHNILENLTCILI